MQTNLVMLADLQKLSAVGASGREIILAMCLEPADWRQPCDDLRMVLSAQPDAGLALPAHQIGAVDRRRIDVELRTHGVCGHLPGVSEPPTMRSQVPFGRATNSLGLLSLVLCPAQACAAPAQSFLAALAMP